MKHIVLSVLHVRNIVNLLTGFLIESLIILNIFISEFVEENIIMNCNRTKSFLSYVFFFKTSYMSFQF